MGEPEQGLLEHNAEALPAQSTGDPANNIHWERDREQDKIHGTVKGEALEEDQVGIGCKDRMGAGLSSSSQRDSLRRWRVPKDWRILESKYAGMFE